MFKESSGEGSAKSSCPHPKISPKQTDPFPKHESHLNFHQPIDPAPVPWEPAVPSLVRSDVLQLTFRVVKVKPSDATLFATIVPFRLTENYPVTHLLIRYLSLFNTDGRSRSLRTARIRYSLARGCLCALIEEMARINESEFERLVDGICQDRELIIKHNPIGTREETLLWMLSSCLVTYLSLGDSEMPRFTGRPDADTYRQAIRFILRNHAVDGFDGEPYLAKLSSECL